MEDFQKSNDASAGLNDDPHHSQCCMPIAIVGMGCRWPGGVSSPEQLWQLLAEKRSGFQEFQKDRINVDGFYHPDRHRPGSMVTRGGYLLQEDPKAFDHAFFGISAVETMTMDPSQRKLLEVVYEAFESAGDTWEDVDGSRTGVFVGNFSCDHQVMQLRDTDYILPYATTGGGMAILSNRISYVFNLKGPSLTLDTACSSSMYALHLAVNAIRCGDCTAAIVAGSNLIMGPDGQLLTTKLGAASPTSTCHTFDRAADGYGRAEGVGALYLKKIPDALAHKDPIRAVIRGTAANTNGKTSGISHPDPGGQEAVIRQAYESAGGLDPDMTGYFECHGTGTPVGDPVEVSAIGRIFASGRIEERLLIGSIKTNLGHSESSSGIAGIMKAVLALERGLIPPTIGLLNPNPAIDFEGANVEVVTQMTPWPCKPVRRASVNSFGYGGANAHCILEHPNSIVPGYSLFCYKQRLERDDKLQTFAHLTERNSNGITKIQDNQSSTSDGPTPTWRSQPILVNSTHTRARELVLLPFSGHEQCSLEANVAAIAKVANNYNMADLAYTLSSRRSSFDQRAFVVLGTDSSVTGLNLDDLIYCKDSRSRIRRIGFVFTGQGAQWPGMGAALFKEYQVFRDTIEYLDKILATLSVKPSWPIKAAFVAEVTSDQINEAKHSQTVCTALQIALVNLLKQWSIEPAVTVGHSSGEIAAAYAAGYLTAAEAIVIAFLRGQVIASNKRKGSMLAVGLSSDDVLPYLRDVGQDVVIAAVNSPESVTLSGEAPAITQLSKTMEQAQVFNRVLKTDGNAYHSDHMAALGETYESLVFQGLREVAEYVTAEPKLRPTAQWISSVHPYEHVSESSLSASYWRRNLESPVLFSQAVEALASSTESAVDVLIEIGPHPALSGPLMQIRTSLTGTRAIKTPACLPTLVRGQHALKSMLNLAGNLFLEKFPLDLTAVNATDETRDGQLLLCHGSFCVDLPPYAYCYGPTPLYHENRLNREWRQRTHPRHDLLGSRQPGGSRLYPAWKNKLRLKDLPWLRDHEIKPHTIFPAAGYLAMAVEAISQLQFDKEHAEPMSGCELRNVEIKAALSIPDDEFGVDMIFTMHAVALTTSKPSTRWFNFIITSAAPDSDHWTEHCSGVVGTGNEPKRANIDLITNDSSKKLNISQWYDKFADVGLQYGPTFRRLSNLKFYRNTDTMCANVALTPASGTVEGGESHYPIHPATLDSCLQLALIACHSGQAENLQGAFVPIHLDQVSIYIPSKVDQVDSHGHGLTTGVSRGLRSLYGTAQLFSQSGTALMSIKEIRCISYDGGSTSLKRTELSREPYLRLVWKPDIDALSNGFARTMFQSQIESTPLSSIHEKYHQLVTYMLVEFFIAHQDILQQGHAEDLQMFLSWLKQYIACAKAGTLRHGGYALDAPRHVRANSIEKLSAELGNVLEVKLLRCVFDTLPQKSPNNSSFSWSHMEDDNLIDICASGITLSAAYPQLVRIVDLLAHKNPSMRILDIGTGSVRATGSILDTLAGATNLKRYKSYVYTDISPTGLSIAESEFSAYGGMIYRALNIGKDPLLQGFEPEFDLILASQGLYEVGNSTEYIRNARRLLKDGGKMGFVVLKEAYIGTGMILGTLKGYWKRIGDDATASPRQDLAWWGEALSKNGFSGADIALDNSSGENAMASVILTAAVPRPSSIMLGPSQDLSVYLVYRLYRPPLARSIERLLARNGIRSICTPLLQASIPEASNIISLIDIEGSTITDCSQAEFDSVKVIIRQASSLIWVSVGTLLNAPQAESSIMVGMLRSIATEMPQAKFTSLTLDLDFNQSLIATAQIIVQMFHDLKLHDGPNVRDREYVMHKGCLHVSRLVPDRVLNAQFRARTKKEVVTQLLPMDSQGPLRANYEQPGLLSSLYFETDTDFSTPLRSDWVEIETRAVGLNMKDLAVASGRFDWNYLSTECSGVISRIGSDVTALKVGDRVYGAVPGNLGNYCRSSAALVQKMDPKHDFEEVASIPVVYMTAVYAFVHLARLRKGESVLIHSATGGLGLAALRIAQHFGTEIYATAGTPEKIEVLVTVFGIARDRIFCSRDIKAIPKIMKATNGKGIDVILSSAAGDQMHELWRCIAPMGHFIDVGRTDIMGSGKLGLEVFKRNATFSSFDLGLMNQQNPEFVAKLMAEVGQWHREGVIKPIEFIRTFDISQLEQAMMYFSRGTHIGKIVVTYSNHKAMLKTIPDAPRIHFDSEATYLLIGGLGGLGRSISVWMSGRGARHLTFLSRSGADLSDVAAAVKEFESSGLVTEVIKCNVTVKKDVFAAVEGISKKRAIKGVLHLAMVEGDSVLENISFEQKEAVLGPKVQGTINLHEATIQLPLEFFIMTSSIVTMVGTASQASYCAANAFQDAFARYRLSQKLPACSIALGLIDDVGFVSQLPRVKEALVRNGVYGTSETEFLQLLEAAFLPQPVQPEWATDPLATAHLLVGLEPARIARTGLCVADFIWRMDARFGAILQAVEDQTQDRATDKRGESLLARLDGASPTEELQTVVTEAVVEKFAKLLTVPMEKVDATREISKYGMDSMIAAELRNWVYKTFGTDIPLLKLMDPATDVKGLAKVIVDSIYPK